MDVVVSNNEQGRGRISVPERIGDNILGVLDQVGREVLVIQGVEVPLDLERGSVNALEDGYNIG